MSSSTNSNKSGKKQELLRRRPLTKRVLCPEEGGVGCEVRERLVAPTDPIQHQGEDPLDLFGLHLAAPDDRGDFRDGVEHRFVRIEFRSFDQCFCHLWVAEAVGANVSGVLDKGYRDLFLALCCLELVLREERGELSWRQLLFAVLLHLIDFVDPLHWRLRDHHETVGSRLPDLDSLELFLLLGFEVLEGEES